MTDLHDEVYSYAIGGLSPAEARASEEHLTGCVSCRQELAHLQALAAELSATVAAAPSATLRASVLTAIADVPQAAVSATHPSGLRLAIAPPKPTSSSSGSGSQAVAPVRRVRSFWMPLLAAAAVIAAVTFGGWAWQGREAAHQAALDSTQQIAELTALLSAEDVKIATGRGVTSGTTGSVVLSPSQRKAVLVASHLPELPAGKTYEAWTMTPEPVPAGAFTTAQDKAIVELPSDALDAQSVAITVEPAGGSEHPTSDPIFTVNMPQSI